MSKKVVIDLDDLINHIKVKAEFKKSTKEVEDIIYTFIDFFDCVDLMDVSDELEKLWNTYE